ncbi:hypothetical protein CFC21_093342 [Triticum aestivum]|uniref:DUF1618 domain-containing protein n=3 Tax=Triticinae TaxID=1648030 RepID=A0A3B6QJ40_WHEAT|nr:uncharacterized protein LOC123141681 [Triticum aestivum]XP_045086359.1 uncharacterized protein LOC123494521 [Aegilops tauschii subsp. strangulata]KAF7090617.1 hypothetical protein CFC21_093342 [Triticum aestivum]
MAGAAFIGSREGHDIPSTMLLDLFGSVSPSRSAATATSKTSAGLPIAVTLCALRPPVLSYLSVDCAACPEPEPLSLAPKVIAADADLVLLRVPVDRSARFSIRFCDYFVYTAHPRRPRLDLLPTSAPHRFEFQDPEMAILSCGDGDGGGGYAVAALQTLGKFTFTLYLYRSGPDGEQGAWTSKVVEVEEPLRDKVCPTTLPSSPGLFHHRTNNVITLGGAKGTVIWVDLWRGIVLCDVLEDSPKLRDMPLPLPSKGNRNVHLDGCPYYARSVVVNQSKDTIKYVEMEIYQAIPLTPEDKAHHEWLSQQECPMYFLVPSPWKATTWSMPVPVTSWEAWPGGPDAPPARRKSTSLPTSRCVIRSCARKRGEPCPPCDASACLTPP